MGGIEKLSITDAPYFTPEIRRLIEEYAIGAREKKGKTIYLLPVWVITRVQELAEREVGLR